MQRTTVGGLAQMFAGQETRWPIVILAVMLFSCLTGCNRREPKIAQYFDLAQLPVPDSSVVSFVPHQGYLLMFVRWPDFNCHTCFDSFQEVTTAVDDLFKKRKLGRNILMIASYDETRETTQRIIQGTMRSRGWTLPCAFVPRRSLENWEIHKSGLMLLTSKGEIEYSKSFPLQPDEVSLFFDGLFKEGGD